MAAAVLGISAFGSVPVTAAESTEIADPGAAMMVDGEAVSSDLVAGTFKPSDVTCKAQDSYEYPFLGLKLSLSKEQLKQITKQTHDLVEEQYRIYNHSLLPQLKINGGRVIKEHEQLSESEA